MKLYMKQKVFSWTDKFTVWDEQEQDCFYIEGEFFTFGKKLHIYDTNHAEVAFIREKVLSWMPRFIVEIGGTEAFQIAKRFRWLTHSYDLEGTGWHVEGDFWGHDYVVQDATGNEVMRLSKHWFTWGDSYELEIANPQDAITCLCIVLAIDAAIDASNASASSAST